MGSVDAWGSLKPETADWQFVPFPKGPKIEKIQDHPPGLKISIEIEIFERATHQTPILVGNSEGPGLNISIEIDVFSIFGPLGFGLSPSVN